MFGLPLDAALKYSGCCVSSPLPGAVHVVPKPVALCCQYLAIYAKNTQGIFRICARPHRIAELAAKMDQLCLGDFAVNKKTAHSKNASVGGSVSAMSVAYPLTEDNWCQGYTAHEVGGMLKAYLKALPEPICTTALYDAFMNVLGLSIILFLYLTRKCLRRRIIKTYCSISSALSAFYPLARNISWYMFVNSFIS